MKKILAVCLAVAAMTACKTASAPIDYADPFVGTGFHGHTYPGATTPYGAVQLSPDTRMGNWDAAAGYHYSDNVIYGFSHTHLSGTGCTDLGDILFHPTTKEPKPAEKGYIFEPLTFSHDDEKASPGYYSVEFKNEGVKAELTAATYTGVHRYTYRAGSQMSVIIDMAHLLDNENIDLIDIRQTGFNEISGMRRTQGWTPNQYVYFVARFSRPFEDVLFVNDGKVFVNPDKMQGSNRQAVLKFGISDGTPLVAKVGLSVVSDENAVANLESDIDGDSYDFDAVHRAARGKWEEALSGITVEGGTENDRRNFYSAMYHAMIVPNVVSDYNGQYRRHDMSIADVPEGQKRYSTFSIWDTFRSWHPLLTITDTKMVNDIIASFMDMYRYGERQELPIWPLSAGETGTMIGYHTVSVIADAVMKGICESDVEEVYQAMVRSSNINKKGSDYYIKYGFIPSNIKKESVSCLLEYAYDDWCIAQVAKHLGKDADYREYMDRARNYINVFDGDTMFFRGKRMDGNWEAAFNEFAVDRAFTEATPWQYRFFTPHDTYGLMQLYGGQEQFVEALDNLFTAESRIDGQMSDITGLIGQYAQGNEPSHHMAYLYNYVGQPWKTQAMTRRILEEMYQPTPEGISGNEDCGQMSAWYIMTALGIYPVCPGSNEFNLTTPLFEKAVLKLANGKTLTITANSPGRNVYIDKVTLNGREITVNYISYEDIMGGGELVFELVSKPNTTRGAGPGSAPYSMTKDKEVSIPYTTQDLNLFVGSIEVDLATRTSGAEIYYTLDGTEPTESSTEYTGPFTVSSTKIIRARAFREGFLPSAVFTIEASRAVFKKPDNAEGQRNGVNYSYYEGWVATVYDIEKTKFVERGVLPEPSISEAKQEDHFSFVFSGVLSIPETGIYEFMTRSDDGSVLYIGRDKIVDNDGSHAAIVATGRVALEKGLHNFTLRYFEDYEGQSLDWGWKKLDAEKFEPVPASAIYVK